MQTRGSLRAAVAACVFALLAAGVFFAALARPASAAVVGVVKVLCDANGCGNPPNTGVQSVSPGAIVHYKITLNSPVAATVAVKDTLPAGFQFAYATCGSATFTTPPSSSGVLTLTPVSLAANTPLDCNVYGAFTASVTSIVNQATVVDAANTSNVLGTSNTSNSAMALNPSIPGDLSITKSASTGAVNVSTGAQTVTYTIAVKNAGTTNLMLGGMLTVQDRIKLRPSSVPLIATFVNATCAVTNVSSAPPLTQSQCLATTPNQMQSPLTVNSPGPMDFVSWRFPASGAGSQGILNAGDTITLTYTMTIKAIPGLDCVIVLGGDGIINEAHLALNLPLPNSTALGAPISDTNNNNNTSNPLNTLIVTTGATIVDPACGVAYFPPSPVLKVTKTQVTPQPPNGFPWTSPFNVVTYKITVQNISPNNLSNIYFQDLTLVGPGTPRFKAQAVSLICAACNYTTLWTQQLNGYNDIKYVVTTRLFANSGSLAPTQTVTFYVKVRYYDPDCDSYPGVLPKPVINIARVTRWTASTANGPVVTFGIAQGAALTLMAKPPTCPLQVLKSTTATKIRFNQPVTYTVQYKNLDPLHAHTVGTLIDTMRLTTANYASSLNVNYTYTCTPSGGVTGYPAGTTGTAVVTNTTLPQQGVRLIKNVGWVTFQPLAVLTCTVTVTVSRPAPTDPYCSMSGVLENAAILDGSLFYDPNIAWPNNALPGFYASVQRPLPKCYDVIPNKVPSPSWTWQGGGPVGFTLTVHNGGSDPIGPGPEIVDNTVPQLATTATLGCTPSGCASIWAPGPPTAPAPGPAFGPSKLRILALPANATRVVNFTETSTAAHPFPPAPGQICNTAYGRMRPPLGPLALDFYWKHPDPNNANQTLQAQACIPVLQTGKVAVLKLVTSDPGYTAPASATFPITLACQNGSLVIPSSTVTLGANGTSVIQGIPVGSTCTTTEQLPPPVPVQTHTCLSVGWFPPTITPNPLGPTTAGTMTVAVKNRYGCLVPNNATGRITVKKLVTWDQSYPPPPSSIAFPITVTCSNGPTSTVSLLAGASAQISGVPANGSCTTTEVVPPPVPTAVCPSMGWSPPVITPNPLTPTTSGPMTVTVLNHYGCLSTGGTIVIKKSVTSDPGYTASATTTFPITVQCQSGSTTLPPYNVTVLGNTSAQIANVPAGYTCSTTELLPPPISTPGVPCQSVGWFPPVISPNPLGPTTNGTMTVAVANRYGCLVNNATVNLTVKKLVSFTNFTPPASATFPITVSCPPAAPVTVTLGANQTAPVNGVPVGNTCTVSEVLPPSVPHPACAILGWSPPVITPSPIVASANGVITVQNTFGCLQSTTSGTGTVVVNKVVLSNPPFPAPPTTFTMTLQCGTAPLATATVVNGVATFTGVPGGVPCTVAEQPLPPPIPNPACHFVGWFPVQISPNPVIVPAPGSVTVTAVNRYGCLP
jgi:uncharacterized repeat protein (TIGR01451 family)